MKGEMKFVGHERLRCAFCDMETLHDTYLVGDLLLKFCNDHQPVATLSQPVQLTLDFRGG